MTLFSRFGIGKKISFLINVIFLLASINTASAEDNFSEMQVITPKIRLKAPPFELVSVDGSARKLEDYKGKVILLNFWATWCGPCREEMPALERLEKTFEKRGFIVVAIAADRGKKAMHSVKEHCRMHDVDFTVLLDPDGKVRRDYEINALPTSYIIGRDGKFSGKIIGAREWDSEEAFKFFESFLK